MRLENLLVPLFPVVVDGDRGTQETVRVGTVGDGVRASGSFPGPIGPTILRGATGPGDGYRRLLDGGLVNNVPADAAWLEGAGVVVASDVVAPPVHGRWPGSLPRGLRHLPPALLAALDAIRPGRRYLDLLNAAYLLVQPGGGPPGRAEARSPCTTWATCPSPRKCRGRGARG